MSTRKNTYGARPAKASEKDADMQRLTKDIYRSDIEKLRLFTKMLRRNALFKKAIVTHK
jgi:hypothetical protein